MSKLRPHHLQRHAYVYSPPVDPRPGRHPSREYRTAVCPGGPGRGTGLGSRKSCAWIDLGKSGTTTQGRATSTGSWPRSALGEVGAVFALEASASRAPADGTGCSISVP
jgi:hypothetical protein